MEEIKKQLEEFGFEFDSSPNSCALKIFRKHKFSIEIYVYTSKKYMGLLDVYFNTKNKSTLIKEQANIEWLTQFDKLMTK